MASNVIGDRSVIGPVSGRSRCVVDGAGSAGRFRRALGGDALGLRQFDQRQRVAERSRGIRSRFSRADHGWVIRCGSGSAASATLWSGRFADSG